MKWYATCILYGDLNIYSELVTSVKIHNWWIVTQKIPHIFKSLSSIMAILMGGQPNGLQRNFKSQSCQLCESNDKKDLIHILFNCSELNEVRTNNLTNLNKVMPRAMVEEFNGMNVAEKLKFLLSPLHSQYIAEWKDIYVEIAKFVNAIYSLRAKLYDESSMNV